jgi:hypothetical protein
VDSCRSKHSLASALFIGIALYSCTGCAMRASRAPRMSDNTFAVHFCDLVRNPAQYDGKVVVVRASLRSDIASDEMFCLSCLGMGGTQWEGSRRLRKKIPVPAIVNATFVGVFESSKGPYGHMGLYRFSFRATSARDMSVVYRGTTPPLSLSAELQAKMCH